MIPFLIRVIVLVIFGIRTVVPGNVQYKLQNVHEISYILQNWGQETTGEVDNSKNGIRKRRSLVQSSIPGDESNDADQNVLHFTMNMTGKSFFFELFPQDGLIHKELDLTTAVKDDNKIGSGYGMGFKVRPYRGSVYNQEQVQQEPEATVPGLSSWVVDPINLSKAPPLGTVQLTLWEDGSPCPTSDNSDSTVRLCDPMIEGQFQIGAETYVIQPTHIFQRFHQHQRHLFVKHNLDMNLLGNSVVYQVLPLQGDQETTSPGEVCGFEQLEHNQVWMKKRSFEASQGHSLKKRLFQGCPATTMVANLGVAADCTYTNFYGGPMNALQKIVSDLNQASSLYESSLNIQLVLRDLEIRTVCSNASTAYTNQGWNQDCKSNYAITSRLSDFSQWRGTKSPDDIVLWHLMTTCSMQSTIGIAWLGQACQSDVRETNQGGTSQYVSNTGVSSATVQEWKVFAHEVGHGFGAIHDCTSATCPSVPGSCCTCTPSCDCQGQFIMNPTADIQTGSFSPCSLTTMCHYYASSIKCLAPPSSLSSDTPNPITVAQDIASGTAYCGNGIKEGNEECDCGDSVECAKDPCCNQDCTLKQGKVCSDRNSLCCQNCQYMAQGSVCRPSRSSDCDPSEVCTGNNPECPPDITAQNGQRCGNSGVNTVCTGGYCTNRLMQCASRGFPPPSTTIDCDSISKDCTLICPLASSGDQCSLLPGFFMDGTQCLNGGYCVSGVCQGSSKVLDALSFIDNNPYYGIAIVCAAGIVFLIMVYGTWRYIKNKRELKARRVVSTQPATTSTSSRKR